MNDIAQRLSACFSRNIKGIKPEEIKGAVAGKTAVWDSLTHVRLLSAVEEEFGFQFDLEDFEELTSYEAIEARVSKRLANG
jgi:acyl carrier protein